MRNSEFLGISPRADRRASSDVRSVVGRAISPTTYGFARNSAAIDRERNFDLAAVEPRSWIATWRTKEAEERGRGYSGWIPFAWGMPAMTYSQTQHPHVTPLLVFSPFRTRPLSTPSWSPVWSDDHIFLRPAIIRLKLPVRPVPRKTYNAATLVRGGVPALPVGVTKRSLQIQASNARS